MHKQTIKNITYHFPDLKTLLAKATPQRSGDELASVSAKSAQERVAAQMALADIPLKIFQRIIIRENMEVGIIEMHFNIFGRNGG